MFERSALVIIGKVFQLRRKIERFENRPLSGQTIAVTRMRDQAESLSGPLAAAGANVIEVPTIELAPVDDYRDVDEALKNLSNYDWLVLTSCNGVDAMFARIDALGLDMRALVPVKIAAIGSATAAAMGDHGVRPDLIPAEAVGEAMADALIEQGVEGKRVLMLRAQIAREDLPQALTRAGAECEDLPIYQTVCPKQLPKPFVDKLNEGTIDWVTVTSPSSFTNLLKLLPPEQCASLRKIKLASIGPVSTQAIRSAGFTETVEADPHDVPGLVNAICGHGCN